MTPKQKRVRCRALIDWLATVGIVLLVGAIMFFVLSDALDGEPMDGHQLADEYSSFNFYPSEEQ